MTTYYHVTSDRYELGDDLLSWDRLLDAGIVTEADWRWDEAPVGFDGEVVCLHETIDAARAFRAEYGGARILAITPDEDAIARGEYYETRGGLIWPTLTRVAEGYPAIRDGIPAAWISEVE